MNNRLNNQQILIIGAGWAGLPLAQLLTFHGADVIATKREIPSQLEREIKAATSTYSGSLQLKSLSERELFQEETQSQMESYFQDRTIIITIPPSPFIGNKKEKWENKKPIDQEASHQTPAPTYGEMIGRIVELAEIYQARELLFLSSTSLYGATSGLIHEEIPPLPQTQNAKAILTAEIVIRSSKIPSTILRLGGLIGNGRHPIFSLAGREEIKSPYDAINLLHIEDLLSAIATLIAQQERKNNKNPKEIEIIDRIYNLVTPLHLERKSYYQAMAKKLDLPLPQFETPKPLLKRIIDGGKITHETDFIYQQLDLINAPLTPLTPLTSLTPKHIESIKIFSIDQ